MEYRNVAEGDSPVFEVEDINWYEISPVAHGSRGLRRQRLSGMTSKTVNTVLHGVRIYEPMRRLLAGRVDFNQFIDLVGESYQKNILDEIYACFTGITADDLGDPVYYPTAGTYNEDDLLDIIAHVEASTGRQATLMGTAKALRNLAPSIQGYDSRSDIYNRGFYGRFFGTPTMVIPQRHKIGSTEFIFSDNTIYVNAADTKPIKFVYEGNSIIKLTDPMDNADMTQEYEFYSAYGLAYVSAGATGLGIYEFT